MDNRPSVRTHNIITALALQLFEFRSLTHLDASYNKCTAVPDDLGRGVRLQRLLLKGNTIELNTAFWFENLTALLELDISDNQITALPVTIGLLTQIQVLRVEGELRSSATTRLMTRGSPMCYRCLSAVIHARVQAILCGRRRSSW